LPELVARRLITMKESLVHNGRVIEFFERPNSRLCCGVEVEGIGLLIFGKLGFEDVSFEKAEEFARGLIDEGSGRIA
jgi:hypothetical protein